MSIMFNNVLQIWKVKKGLYHNQIQSSFNQQQASCLLNLQDGVKM